MPKIPRRLASLILNPLLVCCKRAVLCILQRERWKRASLTVEAAVILPLFLIGMLMLVSVIDVCRIQTVEQTALVEKAKQLAMYSYGISDEPYVDLAVVKSCVLPVSLVPGYKVPLVLRARTHAWVGRTEKECASDKGSQVGDLVYVTDNQSVYHEDGKCSHLQLSIYGAAKGQVENYRNNNGGRYHACEKCSSSSGNAGICYISPNGSAYHNSLQCSGLTRNVRMIKKSEVAGLVSCSRCGGN